MKKIILLFSIFISSLCFSQKIVENKTDEFTKKTILRSDWEKLTSTEYASYINLNKIEGTYFLGLKVITMTVCSVSENNKISFLFDDGSVLELENMKYAISGYGDGAIGLSGSQALGLSLNLILSNENLEILKNKTIVKIRINTSKGFIEDKVKEKNSVILKKMLSLF